MAHLILIDGTAFLHRAFHFAADMRRADGTPVGGINSFCSMIWRLLGRFNSATHIAVIGDAGGAPTFRHRLDVNYKANRSSKPPELKTQLAAMPDAVRAFGLPYVAVPGIEADDIIATYTAKWAGERYMDGPGYANLVTIVSGDKDMMQLVDTNVVLFEPRDELFMRESEVVKKFGVHPRLMVDYLALVGDTSDNVKGVPSIGPVTAVELLAAHGSIGGIYDNLDKLTPRLARLFEVHMIALSLAVKLVTLKCDVQGLPDPAGFVFNHKRREYTKLAAYCRSNELESLAARVEAGWHQ